MDFRIEKLHLGLVYTWLYRFTQIKERINIRSTDVSGVLDYYCEWHREITGNIFKFIKTVESCKLDLAGKEIATETLCILVTAQVLMEKIYELYCIFYIDFFYFM